MRKGRLELWLGAGCVALVVAVAFFGTHHRRFQALYYRWQFLHGEKAAVAEPLHRLAALGPEGEGQLEQLVVRDPAAGLTLLSRHEQKVTVRNDRPHRVYVGDPSTDAFTTIATSFKGSHGDYTRAVSWIMQRCDGSRTLFRVDPPADQAAASPVIQAALRWLSVHAEPEVLDPGETGEFWIWPEWPPCP